MTDIHVEYQSRLAQTRGEIQIYDRFGRAGEMQLTVEEAKHVRNRLDEVLRNEA